MQIVMNEALAKELVDLVIEQLHDWGDIYEVKYGGFSEDKRQELAAAIVAKCEE
jgi:hypothetical protein